VWLGEVFTFAARWCIVAHEVLRPPAGLPESVTVLPHVVIPPLQSILVCQIDLELEDAPIHERAFLRREAVLSAVLSACEVEVPADEVARRVDRMIQNFQGQLATAGTTLSEYLIQTGKSEQTLREQLRTLAAEAIKKEAVLWRIAEEQGIAVTPADLHARVAHMATLSSRSPAEMRAALEADGRVDAIVQEVLFDKVTEFLVDRCLTV
jgi:FKBP-type peptidyl-prolyl cis-trans isomerase (trigger factor)